MDRDIVVQESHGRAGVRNGSLNVGLFGLGCGCLESLGIYLQVSSLREESQ